MRGDGGGSDGPKQGVQAPDSTVMTVCIVDDDAAVRAAMRNLLEASGHEALVFASGEAFLASPVLDRVDLAVLDIKLRGMDGFAVQQQCLRLGLQLPVLFISGNGDHDTERRAIEAGAIALLRKPVDPERLCAFIEERRGMRRPRA